MKRRNAIIWIALVAVACLWLGWKAGWFMALDACKDAGGAWEFRGSYCYGTNAAVE